MLAKPGTFARAQTSLAVVPRPIHAVRMRAQRLGRYAQITRIAARYGFGRSLGLSDDDQPAEGRAPIPVRVRRALEDAGGVFVKLGQIMSTRADLLPPPMIDELSHLQDHVSPVDRGEVEEMLEDELGAKVSSVFTEFDWDPLAAASIAQAYQAQLGDGRRVIVKAQRPGIADAIDRDLGVIRQLGDTLETRTAWASEYHVAELVEEFSERLREELDFRVEARNAVEMAERLDPEGGVVIPAVDQELSTERVLVMEWFDGVSVREVEKIDAMGLDRRELAESLLRCCLQQMLVDGHFHADPHPGNVLVLPNGTIGLIDFGATGRLDALEGSSLRQIMYAVSTQDASLLRQGVLEMATVRRGFDDDQFERSLARFMARHLAPGTVPSAAMFNELLQLFFSFGISLPPEFSTFFRAMITLEGTLRTLSPDFPVIARAQVIAGEWARDRMAPSGLGEMAKNEVLKLAPLLRRLPRHVDRLATIVERGDLRARVSLFSVQDDVNVVTRLVNRILLAFLGGAVGVMSVVLIGISGGPEFTGETTLYELLGYFGLFCGTILIMRVLVSIFRDGLN
jgi:ubiquinone biosynthesis protein